MIDNRTIPAESIEWVLCAGCNQQVPSTEVGPYSLCSVCETLVDLENIDNNEPSFTGL